MWAKANFPAESLTKARNEAHTSPCSNMPVCMNSRQGRFNVGAVGSIFERYLIVALDYGLRACCKASFLIGIKTTLSAIACALFGVSSVNSSCLPFVHHPTALFNPAALAKANRTACISTQNTECLRMVKSRVDNRCRTSQALLQGLIDALLPMKCTIGDCTSYCPE